MLVADTYLGRLEGRGSAEGDDTPTVDPTDFDRDGEPVRILVDDTDRRRSRFRTTSTDGRDLGVAVGRTLRDGDVLDADGTPVLVELERVDAVALALDGLETAEALAFGHALGNRHRDLAIADGEALVPNPETVEDIEETLREALPSGVELAHTTVPPSVFDDRGGGPPLASAADTPHGSTRHDHEDGSAQTHAGGADHHHAGQEHHAGHDHHAGTDHHSGQEHHAVHDHGQENQEPQTEYDATHEQHHHTQSDDRDDATVPSDSAKLEEEAEQ